jgi:hypothetical protein
MLTTPWSGGLTKEAMHTLQGDIIIWMARLAEAHGRPEAA